MCMAACACAGLPLSFTCLMLHGQATCAKTGEGLMEGMEWIAQRVKGEAAQAAALARKSALPKLLRPDVSVKELGHTGRSRTRTCPASAQAGLCTYSSASRKPSASGADCWSSQCSEPLLAVHCPHESTKLAQKQNLCA